MTLQQDALDRKAREWVKYNVMGNYGTSTRFGAKMLIDLNTLTYVLIHPEYVPYSMYGPLTALRTRALSVNEMKIVLEWYEVNGFRLAKEFLQALESGGSRRIKMRYPRGTGERIMYEIYERQAGNLILARWALQMEEEIRRSMEVLRTEMGGDRNNSKIMLNDRLIQELARLKQDQKRLGQSAYNIFSGCSLDVKGWSMIEEQTQEKVWITEGEALDMIRRSIGEL